MQTQEILIRAKNAAKEMHKFGTDDINLALEYMADAHSADRLQSTLQNSLKAKA